MRLRLAKLIAAVLCCLVPPAFGQNWPERPIRIILSFAPGGGTDIVARLLANRLTVSLGHSVFVENRAGAGGTIGNAIVAKAPPDGYTQLFSPGAAMTVNATLYPKLPYDTAKDFASISLVATQPHVVAVHPAVPAKTIAELIAWIKSNPGKVNFGSAGHGSGTHLASELFMYQGKIVMEHIPYKGGVPAVMATVAGDVQVILASYSAVVPLVQAGKLKLLAITTSRRSPSLPDLPTVNETGVPGYDFSTWYGLFTTAGTPRPVIDKLHSHVVRIVISPEFKEVLLKQGLDTVTSTPAELDAYFKSEIESWAKVVREANLKPE